MTPTTALAVVLLAVLPLGAQTPAAPPPTPAPAVQSAPAASPNPLPDSAYVAIQKSFPVIYSDSAHNNKLHGTVVLAVLFNEAGAQESAEITSGDPILAQCAIDSVRKWRIAPFIHDGRPTKAKVPLTFEFVHEDSAVNFATGEAPVETSGAGVNHVILDIPTALKKVQPAYPPEAKAAHIQGTVTFAAVIGSDGAIRELYVVSGEQSLAKAAWDAVRQWHYKPFLYHGRAVAFDTRILVNFLLSY